MKVKLNRFTGLVSICCLLETEWQLLSASIVVGEFLPEVGHGLLSQGKSEELHRPGYRPQDQQHHSDPAPYSFLSFSENTKNTCL